MAVTSTDQWWGEKLKIAQQESEQAQAENAQLKLMISGATGQGGSPGQKYKPPVTNPGRGEAVFGTGKDGQRFFEFLKASLQIRPNQIMLPFVPKEAETDDMYGEGVDEIEGLGNQANIKDSLQRENVGGTLRDMMLPLLIKEYGKDGSGGYKNPGALLSGMRKLV